MVFILSAYAELFFRKIRALRKVGGGTRASRPTETGNDIPNEYLLAALYLRADEDRPYHTLSVIIFATS